MLIGMNVSAETGEYATILTSLTYQFTQMQGKVSSLNLEFKYVWSS